MLVSLALVAGPATAATSAEGMLRVGSLTTRSASAPVVLRLRVPHDATLGVRANGHAVRSPEIAATGRTARVIHVNVRDGLRAGANRIRLRAARPSGQRDVDVRVVRLRAAQVLADAGADRAVAVRERVRLGAAKTTRGDAHRWQLVRAPKGARATLDEPQRARPWLRADRPGQYELRLTAGSDGDDLRDTDAVTVAVRPADPPIGVRVETAVPGSGAAIRIDGQGVRDTGDRGGIQVVVLDRATRENVESGTVPNGPIGADQLYRMALSRSDTTRYLTIISSSHTSDQATTDALKRVFLQLGAPWDAGIQDGLRNGPGFTLVGNPAGIPGSGTVRVPVRGSASITGYLQVSPVTDRYVLAADGHPTFDTAVPAGRTAQHNTVSWDHRDYEATLPAGTTAGFQLVTVDDFTGAITNEVLATNGGDEGTLQRRTATRLAQLSTGSQPPFVLLQSIGAPHGTTAAWNDVSAAIAALGGNRLLTDNLNGTTDDYALAGRVASVQGTVEGSTLLETTGRVAGSATRNQRSQWEVAMADPYATTNTDLIELANRAPERFPDWATPDQAAAAVFLGKQMGVCTDTVTTCDIRASYWQQYGYPWERRATDLGRAKYPAGESAFTQDDFDAAKRQLTTEIEALNDVKTYFAELQKPFERGAAQDRVDLKEISNALLDSLPNAPGRDARGRILQGVGVTILVAGKGLAQLVKKGLDLTVGKQLSAAAGTIGALFSLASFLTPDGGRPIAGGEVVARASELGEAIAARYEMARSSLAGTALILVSDYGKLTAAARRINGDWALPPTNAPTVAALREGTRAAFAQALVPAAYPVLRTGWGVAGPPTRPLFSTHPLPDYQIEPGNVRSIKCWSGAIEQDGRGGYAPTLDRWFESQPDNGQIHPIARFAADGTPIRAAIFIRPTPIQPPSQDVMAWLLRSTTASPAGLGLSPFEVFDPRNYQNVRELKPYERNCNSF